MSKKTLTKIPDQQEQSLAAQEPSIAQMLSNVLASIQKGDVTAEHVQVAKEVMQLYREHQADKALKEFTIALVALQAQTSQIPATVPVDEKSDGTCRFRFAKRAEIMKMAQPLLTQHGFSITYDTTDEDNRKTTILHLTHRGGHTKSNRFSVTYTKPPGANAAQGDIATGEYGKRGCLYDALGIIVDHSDDARMEGGQYITQEEADDLRKRLKACGGDEAAFLETAGVAHYEAISEQNYDRLIRMLERKEQAQKAKTAQPAQESNEQKQEPERKNAAGEFIF